MKERKNISKLEAEEMSSKGSTRKHEFNRNETPGLRGMQGQGWTKRKGIECEESKEVFLKVRNT